jgi:hypothetical protein
MTFKEPHEANALAAELRRTVAEMAPSGSVARRVSWRVHDSYPREFGILRWIERPKAAFPGHKPDREFHVTDNQGIDRIVPARFITYEE